MCVCVCVCVCVCDSVPTLSPHTAHCPATASEGWSGRCRPYFGAVGGWRRSRNAPPLPMPGETDIQEHAREREREGKMRDRKEEGEGWREDGGGWRVEGGEGQSTKEQDSRQGLCSRVSSNLAELEHTTHDLHSI